MVLIDVNGQNSVSARVFALSCRRGVKPLIGMLPTQHCMASASIPLALGVVLSSSRVRNTVSALLIVAKVTVIVGALMARIVSLVGPAKSQHMTCPSLVSPRKWCSVPLAVLLAALFKQGPWFMFPKARCLWQC